MKGAQLPLQKTVHLATAKPKPFSQGPLKGRRFLGDKMTTKHNHVADRGGKGRGEKKGGSRVNNKQIETDISHGEIILAAKPLSSLPLSIAIQPRSG